MSTKKELLEYGIKMINRGDSFAAVHDYLKRNCGDEELVKEVFTILNTLKFEGKIGAVKTEKRNTLTFGKILGIVCLIAGIVLLKVLWSKGFVSTIPFVFIGVGILGISGAMK